MADPTTRVEEEVVKVGLLAAGAVVAGAVLGVWFALRHPRTTAVAVGGVAAYVYLGPDGLIAAATGLAVGAGGVASAASDVVRLVSSRLVAAGDAVCVAVGQGDPDVRARPAVPAHAHRP